MVPTPACSVLQCQLVLLGKIMCLCLRKLQLMQIKAGSRSAKSQKLCFWAAELENDAGSEISAFCCDVMDATLLTLFSVSTETSFFLCLRCRFCSYQYGRFMGRWLAKKKKKEKTFVSVFFLLMHEHFDFRVCTRDFSVMQFVFFSPPIFLMYKKFSLPFWI